VVNVDRRVRVSVQEVVEKIAVWGWLFIKVLGFLVVLQIFSLAPFLGIFRAPFSELLYFSLIRVPEQIQQDPLQNHSHL
jgi:hypothetical protein